MDISRITDYLFVGGQPSAGEAGQLAELGIELVINMRANARPPAAFQRPPLSALWLKTHDFPLLFIPVEALMDGVRAALPVIERGGRVLAHCHHGRHRGPAMGAAILIARGRSAAEAMALIRARRPKADPQAWHIRRQIHKFEAAWQEQAEA